MRWLPIPGYEGLYEVSSTGLCRGLKWGSSPIIRKTTVNKANGYINVILSKNGRPKNFRVHRLVLMAFSGIPTKDRNHGRHLNGIKTDNRIENLKWGTCLENQMDKVFHGKLNGAKRGQAHHNATLTGVEVKKIRILLREGVYQKDIAYIFGVDQSHVSRISSGVARKYD